GGAGRNRSRAVAPSSPRIVLGRAEHRHGGRPAAAAHAPGPDTDGICAVFELYALSATLNIPADATRAQLLDAMKDIIVGKAAYVGRFRQYPGSAPAVG